MTYALTYEVPADEQMYQLVKDGIGPVSRSDSRTR